MDSYCIPVTKSLHCMSDHGEHKYQSLLHALPMYEPHSNDLYSRHHMTYHTQR